MRLQSLHSTQPASTLAALGILGPLAFGQGLIEEAEVLAYSTGDIAPGLAPIEIGGGFPLENPIVTENDLLAFRVRLIGATVTSNIDNRAYVYGSSRESLELLVRGGDPAPGLAGFTLDSGSSSGLASSLRISGDQVFFGSRVNGPGVTFDDDSAYFGGPLSSPTLWVREGDPAPGTVGAVFDSSFASFSHQSTGLNEAGTGTTILFKSNLDLGDTTTENNAGWFYGDPNLGLTLIQREGDTYADGTALSALGFVSQMNSSGQVLLDGTLMDGAGPDPVTPANDRAAWIYDPTNGLQLIAREGDVAPGTSGGTFSSPTDFWSFSVGRNCFNDAGQWCANLQIQGGDVVSEINDRAIFLGGPSGVVPVIREGDLALGTDGFFGAFNNTSLNLDAQGRIAFQGSIDGGTQIDETDSGIWFWNGTAPALIAREGDVAPGTGGRIFGSVFGQSMQMNSAGQILFTVPTLDPVDLSSVGSQIFAWDETFGLRPVVISGDQLTVNDTTTETVQGASFVGNTNNSGNTLSLSGSGDYVLRVTFESGERAVVRGNLGTLSGSPHTLSLADAPAVHTMNLKAGSSNANGLYLLAGSVSGETPGVPLPPFVVPLNPDAYQTYTVTNANNPPLSGSFGFLDANGEATATFSLPAGTNPALAGVQFWHAYVAFDLTGIPTLASNAATFTLIP